MNDCLKIGEFELYWLQGGVFELDGGTMFGVVPKVLWIKKYPCDDENYIKLTNSPILVKSPKANIIIETGLGNKLTDKQRKIYRVKEPWDVPNSLALLGIKREDINYVVLTHCDFDHAGGIVMNSENGEPELTFPNAKHIVQADEWEDVQNPNERASSTYWPQNFTGLIEGKNLRIIDGDLDLDDGIRLMRTAGHTRGHQIVWIQSNGQTAVHMADLLPTHAHFNPLWVMAYDNFPLDAIDQKEKIEKSALKLNAWFTFYHDATMRACKFDEKGNVTERFV